MRTGRPKLPKHKRLSHQFGIRFTDDERWLLERQRRKDGFDSLAKWMRFIIKDYVRYMNPDPVLTFDVIKPSKTKHAPQSNSIAFGTERVRYKACPCGMLP